MTLNLVVLPGDGIGPEVTKAAEDVLSAVCKGAGLELKTSHHLIGGIAIDETGNPLPEETLNACADAQGVLLGAVGGPKWDGGSVRPEQGLLRIREALGLFTNIRPVRVFDGLEHLSPIKNATGLDIVIVRELTGGIYFGERQEGDEVASDLCTYSAEEVRRVVAPAFEIAKARNGKLTSVDKANVLASSRLWRRTAEAVARDYPEVTLSHALVDAMAMHLVTHPNDFDVLVTENMFGDILSDEAAAVSGSIGLAASASLGAPGTPGLYEPIHGSAPDIAGQGVANPSGAILSAAMFLRFGAAREDLASQIEAAVESALKAGVLTRDLGGDANTEEMTSAILERL
ncbi:3-isopropylmalate dehydrogenase [Parvularcula marina]|uniref:3-isopropylmalate dehydrogenase n=1 Tax=Parvularcula marina TaxID=2292771 RepID=UPI0035153C51